jgi:hypothetical protein
MFGDYEIVKEDNDSFSAVLNENGMKAANGKTEDDVVFRMQALDAAYEIGLAQGIKEEKDRIKMVLGL